MRIRRVVVAPDSFKGSLTAMEVAECCEKGILDVFPQAEVVKLPLADGGEGTVAALASSLDGHLERCPVRDPLMRKREAVYAITNGGKTAIMEMAAASGLPMLEPCERNPLHTSSYGVGEMITDALDKGCREICVGLGGSATNEGGMGMLRALGFVFKDADGRELAGVGEDLRKVAFIETGNADSRLATTRFVAACDVDNPFYGPEGAAYVFAPQKGADEESVRMLDDGLRNYAAVVEAQTGKDLQAIAGAGAAGGLGGAFAAFLSAHVCRGVDMVLDAVGFDEKAGRADLIITGEGRIDRQSLMGKVLSGVLRRGAQAKVPVIAVGGMVSDSEDLERAGLVAAIPVVQGITTLEKAMSRDEAGRNVRDAIHRVMRIIAIS